MQDIPINKFCLGGLALLLILAFASCSSERTFYTYAAKNPNKVAELCAKEFYSPDSVPPPVIRYVPANNIDYKPQLDSLQDGVDRAVAKADKDSVNLTSREKEYRSTIKGLQGTIKNLRDSYEKCKPDTQFINNTIYRDKPSTLAKLKDTQNKLDAANQSIASKNTIIYILLGALGVSVLAFILRNKFAFLKFLR